MKNYLITLFLVLILISNANALFQTGDQDSSGPDPVRFADGVLVIKFSPEVDLGTFQSKSGNITTGIYEIDREFNKNSVTTFEALFVSDNAKSNDDNLSRFYRIEFPANISINEFKNKLQEFGSIELVELVGIHRIDAIPNDGAFGSQWHHRRTDDHDIDSDQAWDVETGDSTVIVAIIDTGVLWSHPDLGGPSPYTNGNIWINWAEYNGTDSVDDDGNGYVDDFRGWDWVNVFGSWPGEDGSSPDNDPADYNGHGTHCAGIAAAMTNNGIGVAGVAGGFYPANRGVKIMCLRVGWSEAHPTYGYETGFVRMDYCAQAFYYAVNNGADVLSCSWGSSSNSGFSAAVTYAIDNGVLVCTSAGNDGDSNPDYLGNHPDAIAVASTTSGDTKSSFSDYGPWVDIAAPGSGIYSTYSNHGSPTYTSLSGTSMSCPMVAGLIGLIKSRDTNLTDDDLKTILFDNADNIDAYNPSYTGLLGAGRINSFNSVNQFVYATFEGSPRMGLHPLTVDFNGDSPFQVEDWKYYFGDGDSSSLQSPQHTYTDPGRYDLTMQVSTSLGDAESIESEYIYVLADTMHIGGFEGTTADTEITIPISLTNIAPVNEIIIPLTFAGPLNLGYVGFSTSGTRSDYFEYKQLLGYNHALKAVTLKLVANNGGGTAPLDPGSGDILLVTFSNSSANEGTQQIDTVNANGQVLYFSTHVGEYLPVLTKSPITIFNGNRGDASGDGQVNVSDAVFIINYVFVSGPVPASTCGGDANNDDTINVSDAVYIINYVFQGGDEPEPCF